MNGPGRRFDPSELLGGPGPEPTTAELADALAAARALEADAAGDVVRPTSGFEDRVMAAIATEPAPRFVVGPGSSRRGGRPAAFLVAVRDAWAIATGGGRPLAVRAQALGFVLLVVIAAGSITGVAAVGVGSFLAARPSPLPSLPAPSIEPSPSPSPTSSPSPSPTVGPSPSPSSSALPAETAGPTPTPRSTETPRPTETAEPTETAQPTESPSATESPASTGTPEPSDDHGGGSPGPG